MREAPDSAKAIWPTRPMNERRLWDWASHVAIRLLTESSGSDIDMSMQH